MHNVFIAIGGTGTKVAEALVRLLALGFPTKTASLGSGSGKHSDVVTSAGETLEIWRLDPDRSSGASASLQNCMKDYRDLQEHLGGSIDKDEVAHSGWCMSLDTNVRHLDPLQLSATMGSPKKEARTLKQILDSGGLGKRSAKAFLDAFYEEKELEVDVTKGFYQKPFIGAAVMAIYVKTLEDESSPGGSVCRIRSFDGKQTRFFVCGSLHGGTGSSGVPIMGKFLNDLRARHTGARLSDRPWKIGAALLAPYATAPDPPFQMIPEDQVTQARIDEYFRNYTNHPAFSEVANEEKPELIKQILLGFYADPTDMVARSRQGLLYYKDHLATQFDHLYLIGKPEADKLKAEGWSNGGKTQKNPLNSIEAVAALSAIRFFSDSRPVDRDHYTLATAKQPPDQKKLRLQDLPKYRIWKGDHERIEVDPEKVLLATGLLHHLVTRQIPWELKAKTWSGIEGLRKRYLTDESKKESDEQHLKAAGDLLARFISALLGEGQTTGWDKQDETELSRFLSEDQSQVDELTRKISKRFLFRPGVEPNEPLSLGESKISVSAAEFGKWALVGESFTRGGYLRLVWSTLFTKPSE